MRILVTGGAGFIGSHVAEAYLAAGHEVAIVDDLSRGRRENVPAAARFYQGDICDRDFIEHVFARERPEVVNHHAAQMDVRRGVAEPAFDATVNILGSLALLEASVRHGVQRFIYASTAGAIYGEPERLPVAEDYPVNPISPYGISKHTVEHYLFAWHRLYGLPYVVLRYGNVYGPRQSSKGEAGVFAIFFERMLAGLRPVIYGDGSKLRDYVYIDDVVRANLLALDRGTGEIFNIATGVATSDYEVFCQVRQALGLDGVEPDYAPRRPGEVERIVLDIGRARQRLGWQPEVPLEEGTRRTGVYFRARPQVAQASVAEAKQAGAGLPAQSK